MATVTYESATTDVWLDWSFDDFEPIDFIDTDNGDGTFTTNVIMTGPGAGYDTIVVTATIAEEDVHAFEEGIFAGTDEAILTGGTVDSITFHDSGTLLATVTDLPDALVPYFSHLIVNDDIDNFGLVVQTSDNFFLGTSLDPYDDWGDVIVTGYGKDSVNAKAGDDYIFDLGGRDVYNGAAGVDRLSYAEVYNNPVFVLHGITANLQNGRILGFDGKTDKVSNIEQVVGTFLDDTFIGDDNDNTFYGLAGADSFDGGGGTNRLDYKDEDNQGGYDGIKVDTAAGTIRDGFGTTDTFTNIYRISGTYTRDAFIDDDSSMYYDGRDGDDVFRIRGGDDRLRGRDGEDRFIFIGDDFGDNTIDDFEKGIDEVKINKASDYSDLTITDVADGALVELTSGGVTSSILFEGTAAADLTADVFGL